MYEHGYFTAYQQVVADEPDLVVHVGDYIYERSWGKARVRRHEAPECFTLEDYRARHALYRSDPDLQRAHAACPWLLVWDDHEVGNDYAGDRSEEADVAAWTLARRAAAYRAYYEHLPLPRRAVPFGPDMRIHATRRWGSLATLHLLDTRQYRDPQPCPPPGRAGGHGVKTEDCAALDDAARSMLGAPQEAWLEAQLRASRSRWNLLAQGVVMAPVNTATLPTVRRQTDDWNGYPAARQRLLGQLQQARVANPVVLSGDFHAFMAADLHADPARPGLDARRDRVRHHLGHRRAVARVRRRRLRRQQPGPAARDRRLARLPAARRRRRLAARRPRRDGDDRGASQRVARDRLVRSRPTASPSWSARSACVERRPRRATSDGRRASCAPLSATGRRGFVDHRGGQRIPSPRRLELRQRHQAHGRHGAAVVRGGPARPSNRRVRMTAAMPGIRGPSPAVATTVHSRLRRLPAASPPTTRTCIAPVSVPQRSSSDAAARAATAWRSRSRSRPSLTSAPSQPSPRCASGTSSPARTSSSRSAG